MLPPRSLKALVLAGFLLLAGAMGWWLAHPVRIAPEPRNDDEAPLALFTTLPLYWGEAEDISELVAGEAKPHWAKEALEREEVLAPLDTLTAETLAQFGALMMAQPRALSAEENVALDDWVRGGGRLLLFTDPLLTTESRFALGDPRRPADVALLSPILARWGLELTFDPDQQPGVRKVELFGEEVPVEMAGALREYPTAPGAGGRCEFVAGGLAAECAIGGGGALIIADAALLDADVSDSGERGKALLGLLRESWGTGANE